MAKKSGFSIVNWKGPEIQKKLDRACKSAINETMSACVKRAKRAVPKVTTELQGSIQLTPATGEGTEIKGEWGSYNNLYAIYVITGTRPHMPPVEMLKPWAVKVLGDEKAAWPVALKIAKVGTDPNDFLRPQADIEYPKLKKRLKKYYVG